MTIANTSITCITVSILQQCPSPSPSRLSHALQLQSHNNLHHFHHHRHHVYHMHYSFSLITMSITSITIAIWSITCITASILEQCPSPLPSRLSHALQLQSYTLSITSTTIAITFITCITASILKQYPSTSPSRLSHVLHLRSYNNVHHFHNHRHHVCHTHYSFSPITMSIIIANTSIICITVLIL